MCHVRYVSYLGDCGSIETHSELEDGGHSYGDYGEGRYNGFCSLEL